MADWEDVVDWVEPTNMNTEDIIHMVDRRLREVARCDSTPGSIHIEQTPKVEDLDRVFTYLVLRHILEKLGQFEKEIESLRR